MPVRQERGSAAVEFALVVPLVLVLVLALVQVGLLARDRLLVQAASRAGAREAAVTADAASIASSARAGATDLDPAQLTVQVYRTGTRGDPVTVTITLTDPFKVPLIGWLMGSGTTMTSSSTMRQEFG